MECVVDANSSWTDVGEPPRMLDKEEAAMECVVDPCPIRAGVWMSPGVTAVAIMLGSRELVEFKGKGMLAEGKVLGACCFLTRKSFLASAK